ncbi:MAG: permease [Patescibacteria group bacterium]|nr:permease [Patescibacteria group bacterium]
MDIFFPIQIFADWIVYNLFDLTKETRLAESLNFFIYDAIKILLLLVVINYLMAIVRYYLPIEKLRDFLTSRKFYGFDHLLASTFGAITPFCSCSSIPLFIGFLKAGIPLGVTFSFLITSPLINEVAVAMFIGLFGWKVTLVYVIAGIMIGVIGGYILGKLKVERYIEDFVWKIPSQQNNSLEERLSAKDLVKRFNTETMEITKKIVPYVLAGIALGAAIHGYVPTNFFEKYITKENLFAVPLATVVTVPLYSNVTGVIPIIQALVAKGIPLGTALAFMMGTVGLSFPEAMILKKVMKWQLLAAFFGVVTFGIILIGYLFNLLNLA